MPENTAAVTKRDLQTLRDARQVVNNWMDLIDARHVMTRMWKVVTHLDLFFEVAESHLNSRRS